MVAMCVIIFQRAKNEVEDEFDIIKREWMAEKKSYDSVKVQYR